ncbi:MAG: DUF6913 domain-containing protein [Chitinophagales bacterium]
MFENIQRFFYDYKLKKRLKEHKVKHQVVNLKQAKTVGILFDCNNETHVEAVQKYVRTLEKQKKQVTLLAYVEKQLATETFEFPVFSKKDLTWYWQPKPEAVSEFVQQPFDILINAFLAPSAFFEYIAIFSKAKFRVGPYLENRVHCFDLMINGTEDNLPSFFKKVDHYLEIINQ